MQDEEPEEALYLPAAHTAQSDSLSCGAAEVAESVMYLPASQLMHNEEPSSVLNLPEGQMRQSEALSWRAW